MQYMLLIYTDDAEQELDEAGTEQAIADGWNPDDYDLESGDDDKDDRPRSEKSTGYDDVT